MCAIMFRSFFLIVVAFRCAYCFVLPFEGLYRLDIIHYNDFHSRYEETSVDKLTCRSNNNSCLGGFARFYHAIQILKQEKPDSLLLNAGDNFQGTYWYNVLKWKVTQEFFNLLPHDAHTIGNHEFEDGPEGLAPYLAALEAPVVIANMDTSKEPILQGLYKPHIILERHGRKIGIIGIITPDTKIMSQCGNVEFSDPGKAVEREALELTEKGVDIIVVLSHCGLELDKKIAREHGELVDVVISGHSHSLLWNGHRSPSGEPIHGPYPLFVQPTADQTHEVLIVQASAFTKYIGNLSLYFDFRGDYVKWEGGPVFLDRTIPEDEHIKAKIAPYAKFVHDAESEPVGESATTLSYEECVYGECALGNLRVDALLEFSKETFNSSLDYISLVQKGDLRSSIPRGTVTKGVVFEMLPYREWIKTFVFQGKHILEALEWSASNSWGYKPFRAPNVLQVSGIRVTYNVSQPEGRRVTSVLVGDKGSNTPLDPEKYYQVIAPTFLANGGDGFTMFRNNKRNTQDIGRDQDITEAYIVKHSPLNVTTDGRIVINE